MLRVYVLRQSRYPASISSIKDRVKAVLTEAGVLVSVVNVSLVGVRKMKELGVKYLNEGLGDPTHEVLSFPAAEARGISNFVTDGDFLGDIIICYPEAQKIAIKRNRMMDDVICELVEHGTMHLLGKHHL